MGVYIPNIEMPKTCGECELRALDEWLDEYCVILRSDILVPYERMLDCPLIEIDHTNTELLEFFNEFKKWKASKEVAKYIKAVYGERRTEQSQINTIENTNEIQSEGENNE